MRLFGRILGAFLALCGFVILAMFLSGLATEGWRSWDWKLQVEKPLRAASILVIGAILVNESLLHSLLTGSSAYRFTVLLVLYAMPATMYGLQALFFQYGELRDI
jgi:hypothetical protein